MTNTNVNNSWNLGVLSDWNTDYASSITSVYTEVKYKRYQIRFYYFDITSEVVGFMLDPDDKTNHVIAFARYDSDTQFLSEVQVDSNYRNKGFGTEFVRTITGNLDVRSLIVESDNEYAIKMYLKCGFKSKYITMEL